MQKHKLLLCTTLLLSITFASVSFGQQSFRQLEDKVYQLNNAQQYTESQALLLPLLEKDSYTANEKYQASILLSYTYKRVGDYQSTLKFLEKARQFSQKTTSRDSLNAIITGQEAFAYFDTQAYDRADALMNALDKTRFRYIDLENKAKLRMQQGYLLFKKKQYDKAEATYNQAIGWLKASSPCDLPMILVKKMQLYADMNRMDLLQEALRQSSGYADSCGIIKYHLYAYEELLNIYKARKEPSGMATTILILDSLKKVYDREVKLAALHNQQEELMEAEKKKQALADQTQRNYLIGLAGVLLLVVLLIGLGFWQYRRQKEKELARMKAELEQFIKQNRIIPPTSPAAAPSSSPPTTEPDDEKPYLTVLSERQRDVLDFMAKGMSNREIADQLFISENTVKYHIKNIYLLLEVKDRKRFLAGQKG